VKFLDSLQSLALLLLRAALGLVFLTYGYPKLAGSGPAMQPFFMQHGLPGWFVYLAGVIEFFGGGLLILGLFTRGAAFFLAAEMGVAIWKVHFAKGYLAVHDYEFPLTLAMACLVLVTTGAGTLSLDRAIFGGKSRTPRNSKKV